MVEVAVMVHNLNATANIYLVVLSSAASTYKAATDTNEKESQTHIKVERSLT